MGFFIVRGLSSILEAFLWTYFIISLAKIFTKEEIHFSKKQMIVFVSFSIIIIILRIYN